jgi:uncharacterized protein (DUF1810 family)
MAWTVAIGSLEEAGASRADPLPGRRFNAATRLVMGVEGGTLTAILGTPDDLKLRSSMTLFDRARPVEPILRAALDRFCAEAPDPANLRLLG